MADGLVIHVNSEHAAKLKVLADEVGMSLEDYTIMVLDRQLAIAESLQDAPTS